MALSLPLERDTFYQELIAKELQIKRSRNLNEKIRLLLISCLMTTIFCLSLIYCYQAVVNVQYKSQNQALKTEIATTLDYNRILEAKIENLTSYSNLKPLEQEFKMVKPGKVILLDLENKRLSFLEQPKRP